MKPKALLINPWIYDFSAFDLWMKPLGLLYIAGVLEQNGFDIYMVDCLDRYNQELLRKMDWKTPKGEKKYGCGNFYKEEINKPQIVKNVKRKYSRYGLPLEIFLKEIKNIPKPDVILITSMMTYWYPALVDAIKIIRNIYKDIPVILGGVYATLAFEHAKTILNVDRIIKGEGENQVINTIFEISGESKKNNVFYNSIDDFPFPLFKILENIRYLPILTSRGCPFECTFCASNIVSGKFRTRSVESVIEEIKFHQRKFKIKEFAFYDDALLINKEKHIIPILEGLLRNNIKVNFHTPNGLFSAMIDDDLANIMFASGFKTIRLSLETVNPERLKDINFKIDIDKFESCIESLVMAGYKRKELESYILFGLSNQSVKEVIETMIFAGKLGIKVRLAEFSPIPGTIEWERSVSSGDLLPDTDLLLTNNTLLPLRSKNFSWDIVKELKTFAREINNNSDSETGLFKSNNDCKVKEKLVSKRLLELI